MRLPMRDIVITGISKKLLNDFGLDLRSLLKLHHYLVVHST